MTANQIRTKLHKQIDQLNDIQLQELDRLMADILPEEKNVLKKRPFGLRKGSLKYMADDFDTPLEDFKDYMPAQQTDGRHSEE